MTSTATTPTGITLELGDQYDRVVDALCRAGGYQATIVDADGVEQPNPQTADEYAKSRVAGFVQATVQAIEIEDAQAAATATVQTVTIQ